MLILTLEWKLLGRGKLEPELDLDRLSYSFNNCNFKCDRLLGDAEGVTHRSIRSKSSSTSLLAPSPSIGLCTPFSSFLEFSSPSSPPPPFLLFRPIFKTFNSLICNEEVEKKSLKRLGIIQSKTVEVVVVWKNIKKSSFLVPFLRILKVRCTHIFLIHNFLIWQFYKAYLLRKVQKYNFSLLVIYWNTSIHTLLMWTAYWTDFNYIFINNRTNYEFCLNSWAQFYFPDSELLTGNFSEYGGKRRQKIQLLNITPISQNTLNT